MEERAEDVLFEVDSNVKRKKQLIRRLRATVLVKFLTSS